MKRVVHVLVLLLAACGSPAQSTEPAASSSPAPPATAAPSTTSTLAQVTTPATAAPSATNPFVGRWDAAVGARTLHLVIAQGDHDLAGQLEIRHELPANCSLEVAAGPRDASHLPVRFRCEGPDSEDGSDPPYSEGTTVLVLSSSSASLSGDFGFGPVTVARTVFAGPPTDSTVVSLAPFLGQRSGASEIADYQITTSFADQGGHLAGHLTIGFSDIVECTVTEQPGVRAPGRVAVHEVCAGGSDHEYDATVDCTLELTPDGHITSDDCWEQRTELGPTEE